MLCNGAAKMDTNEILDKVRDDYRAIITLVFAMGRTIVVKQYAVKKLSALLTTVNSLPITARSIDYSLKIRLYVDAYTKDIT